MRSLLFLLALACAPKAPPAAPAADAPAADAPAATLPTPYTAEQIRDAMPTGATMRFRLERADQPTTEMRWEVTASDAQGCTLHSAIYDAATGALVQDEGAMTHTWVELRGHAAFPVEGTVVSEAELDLPMGHRRVTVYRVPDEGVMVDYHFAPELPGPPVLMVVSFGDRELTRMTMLERSPLPGAPAPQP